MSQNNQATNNNRNPLTGAAQPDRNDRTERGERFQGNRRQRSDSYFSNSANREDRYSGGGNSQQARRNRRSSDVPYLGTQLNDAMAAALANLNKRGEESASGKKRAYSSLRRPVVPNLPHYVPADAVDGQDHFNISLEATTPFGKAVGFYNNIVFTDPVTGQDVLSLGNYWNFLKTGMSKPRYLRSNSWANGTGGNEVRNLYAHLAFAVWNKINSIEELKVLLNSGQVRFDFYRYQQNQTLRYSISSYVVDIYREINRALSSNKYPDFARWLDIESQATFRQATTGFSDEEKVQALTELLQSDYQHALEVERNKRESQERKQKADENASIAKAERAQKSKQRNKKPVESNPSEAEEPNAQPELGSALVATFVAENQAVESQEQEPTTDPSASSEGKMQEAPVATDPAYGVSEQPAAVVQIEEPVATEEPSEVTSNDGDVGHVIVLEGMQSQSHITL